MADAEPFDRKAEGLRSRKINLQGRIEDTEEETAQEHVMRLNMEEQKASHGKPRRTFGRTPEGTSKISDRS
jgi:hypothetical protein